MPGTFWQRCRTQRRDLDDYHTQDQRPWVRTPHSIYDQPDADSVIAQYDRVLDALAEKLSEVPAHLETNRPDVLALTVFPEEI